jgi:hypothetical protein
MGMSERPGGDGVNWVRVSYPERRKVYIDGVPLGYTNARQFVGEDGTYEFDLGEPVDYKPKRMRRRVEGTSRRRPLELEFEPRK